MSFWLANLFDRWREFLFGSASVRGRDARGFGVGLLKKLREDSSGLPDLRDEDLISLVEYLLTNGTLRRPLQGNVRFLQSVAVRFRRRNTLSLKQREGILKILLKAYPHNLAHELRGSIQKTC